MTKRNLDNIVFTENMESRLEKIPVNDLLNQHRSWLNREFLLSRRGTGKSPFSIVRLKAVERLDFEVLGFGRSWLLIS